MKRYRSGALAALFVVLAGCGQMGPLVLPTAEPAPSPAPKPEVTVQPLDAAASAVSPNASAPVQETP